MAHDPGDDSGRPLGRYREEHHDQTPEHVPHLPVTGAVRSAQALHYAFDEGANPGEMIIRPGSEVAVELDAVPGAGKQLPGLDSAMDAQIWALFVPNADKDAVEQTAVERNMTEADVRRELVQKFFEGGAE